MHISGLMAVAIGLISLWRLWDRPELIWSAGAIALFLVGQFLPTPRPFARYYPPILLGLWLGLGSLLYLSPRWLDLFWLGWVGGLLGANARNRQKITKQGMNLGFTDAELHDRLLTSMGTWGCGLFMLSTVDLPGYNQWRNLLGATLVILSLLAYTGWRFALNESQRILYLGFAGMWGLQNQYSICLRQFSRLEVVKLQAVPDMQWLTLAGYAQELALPLGLDLTDELEELLRSHCRLAKHRSDRDSLGMVGILLPQGAGIMAGFVLFLLGITLNWVVVPELPSWLAVFLLLAIALVSPCAARLLLELIAPAHLSPTPLKRSWLLLPWEWGLLWGSGLFLISYREHLESFFGLGLSWLSISVSLCLLALVRRTPVLGHQEGH